MRALATAVLLMAVTAIAQEPSSWPIHDTTRPRPPVVAPGTGVPAVPAGQPPADATVLFDGRDLLAWKSSRPEGGPAAWKVENGSFEVVKGAGGIETRQAFGDVQLHLEFREPVPAVGEGQERGNSGVFLMGRYEVQILDSYRNDTYPDGQAAALYGQHPPLVNACRPPGEWQAYDIVFEAPRFGASGSLTRPARVTVFHNGVLVQHATELVGPTAHKARPPYAAHAEKLPLALQDHGNPIRFRNVWLRELSPRP